jgi:hypothetical protein
VRLDAYGGRRWLTTVGIILIASGMRLGDYISDALWADVVKWVFGLFAGANVTQRGVEAAKAVKIGQPDPGPE